MSYVIKQDDCVACDYCHPQCLKGAIKPQPDGQGYWIDPTLCDRCEDVDVPRCISVCSIGALTPLPPKKGRCKSSLLPAAIPDIFLNGQTTPFASSMVVWEACNILMQRQALPWKPDSSEMFFYQRSIHRGRGEIRFRVARNAEAYPTPLGMTEGLEAIEQFDMRAACLHLIFSAYITRLDRPWEDTFAINDQQIEHYLGLEKRKDLTKLKKLTLIKNFVHQACQLLVSLDWPRQGKVPSFSLKEHSIWQLVDTQYYFEEDSQGYRYLIGLRFTIRAGEWTRYFLNQQDYRRHKAFYQYGILPQSVLIEVMSNWQQHEGEVRLLLWLLFKLRLGGDQRLKVQTLLKIAYGEDRVLEATTIRGTHKQLLRTFEGDLEALYIYGLKPLFDVETYPPEIQPLWARVAEIPDNADEALEFWTDDAQQDFSLTSTAPRDKWQRLLNSRFLGFELPSAWQQTAKRSATKRRPARKPAPSPEIKPFAHKLLRTARERLKMSQRALADRLGKSQSWIRDIENGRFSPCNEDLDRLQKILNLVE